MILIAVILGIVEGLTEFLPVSSTGHLIIAGYFLNFTGEKAATFEIFIQLGAILAVVMLYRQRFLGLLNFQAKEGFAGKRGIGVLIMTTLPALVLGAGLHSFIKTHLFNPLTVAIGLVLGSLWIFAVEKKNLKPVKEGLDQISWKDALLIGFFQCIAMWPGISRAGATILGGMMLGLDRKTATEYSFFAAAPVIAAATVLDLVKSLDVLEGSDIPVFAVGFLVSFVAAWLAVKFFIHYVSRHNLSLFGFYRIGLAIAVFLFWK